MPAAHARGAGAAGWRSAAGGAEGPGQPRGRAGLSPGPGLPLYPLQGMGAAASRCAAVLRPHESSPEQVSARGVRAVSGRCLSHGRPPSPGQRVHPELRGSWRPWAVPLLLSAQLRCAAGVARGFSLPADLLFVREQLAPRCLRAGRQGKGGCRGSPRGAAGPGSAPPPPPARWSLC